VSRGTEELLLSLLSGYVSTSVLARPFSDDVRMRTARDMTALEDLVTAVSPACDSSASACPVLREFRSVTALRTVRYRLLRPLWLLVMMLSADVRVRGFH